MKTERSIKRDFQYLSITTIVISMFVLSSFWIFFDYLAYTAESERIRTKHMAEYEDMLKFQVDTIVGNIKRKRSIAEEMLKKELQGRTNEAQQIITTLFRKNSAALPVATLEKLTRDFLTNVRFNEGRGYYFAINMTGVEELFPPHPELEGKDLRSISDGAEKNIIDQMLHIARTSGEGFYQYDWSKPGTSASRYPKMAHIRYIPELDWIIGTGEYLDDATLRLQEEIRKQVEQVRFGKNNENSIFIGTWKGVGITSPAKGENKLETRDVNGLFVVRELIKKAREGGGFVRYIIPGINNEPQKAKLSYATEVPEWQWYVGASVNLDEIDSAVAANRQLFKDKAVLHIELMLTVLLVLILIHSFITTLFSRNIWKQLDLFSQFFRKASTESVSMDGYVFAYSEFREIGNMANKMLQDRNRILQEIRLSRDEWIHTFNAIGDCMMVLDANGRILRANDAAAKLHSLSPEDLVDMPFSALCAHNKAVENTMIDHQPHTVEMEHEKLGRIFLTSAFPILSKDGGLDRIIHIAHDITEQKQLKEQLTQAQKMEAIGTLAGGIAHDFNNILGAMLGYAELAEQTCPPESTLTEYLNQINRAGERAKYLVRQILVFSRQAETQRVPLQPAPLIKEALKLLRASLPATITIEQDIDEQSGPILADPIHIHQILMNLATNAMHAMEESGGTLSISLKRKTFSDPDLTKFPNLQPGDFVGLTIRDSGAGIEPEIRERIFEPYYTTKEPGKGTGMGLSIVHGIVSSYGGFITVASQPGEGTAFDIYFPVLDTGLIDEIETAPTLAVGTERILFVDDEEMLVDMSHVMLEQLGYTVTSFNDSRAAYNAFAEHPDAFDLVITDQTMPGLTGTQLAEKILKIHPGQPIILCTGFSELVSEEKAKAMGIRLLVLKPINMHQLALLIREALAAEVPVQSS